MLPRIALGLVLAVGLLVTIPPAAAAPEVELVMEAPGWVAIRFIGEARDFIQVIAIVEGQTGSVVLGRTLVDGAGGSVANGFVRFFPQEEAWVHVDSGDGLLRETRQVGIAPLEEQRAGFLDECSVPGCLRGEFVLIAYVAGDFERARLLVYVPAGPRAVATGGDAVLMQARDFEGRAIDAHVPHVVRVALGEGVARVQVEDEFVGWFQGHGAESEVWMEGPDGAVSSCPCPLSAFAAAGGLAPGVHEFHYRQVQGEVLLMGAHVRPPSLG